MITDIDQVLRTGAPWPPDDNDIRIQSKMYADNRALWNGDHALVFKEVWERLFRDELNDPVSVEFCLNWFKRLSTLWADMLLGEEPTIKVKNDKDKAYIDELIRRVNFWDYAYMVAIDVSRYGGGLFKSRIKDGEVQVRAIPPSYFIPVVALDDMQDIQAHILAWSEVASYPSDQLNRTAEKGNVYVEIHRPGSVEFRQYGLTYGSIGVLKESYEQATGLDVSLVRYVPNLQTSDSLFGVDDYSGITSLIQDLEVRFAQNSRILDRHADPKMCGPASAVKTEVDASTGEIRNIVNLGDYIPTYTDEIKPEYMTWDGHISDSILHINSVMEQLYALTETSPAAFGDNKSGLAESGSAIKRLLLSTVEKARRLRNTFDNACRGTLKTLATLDGHPLDDIHIEWGDGLPNDWGDDSRIANERVAAGTMSKRRAISVVDGLEGEVLEKEIKDIGDDQPQAVEEPKISLE